MSHFIKLASATGKGTFVNLEAVSRVTFSDGAAYIAYVSGAEMDFTKVTDTEEILQLVARLETLVSLVDLEGGEDA